MCSDFRTSQNQWKVPHPLNVLLGKQRPRLHLSVIATKKPVGKRGEIKPGGAGCELEQQGTTEIVSNRGKDCLMLLAWRQT